jgi:Domain of unknown function (DUF4252)
MNATINGRAAALCFLVALVLLPDAAFAQGGRIQLDHLNRLADKATETVDVTVDSEMLKKSAGFLAGKGTDTAKLQEVVDGIRGIYVKSFKFDVPDAYTDADVEAVRKQVAREGWSRIVGVREKQKLAEIYLWKEGGTNGGLVVIAAEANELTVVNIVGNIDLASLAALGPMIPKLGR